MKFFPGFVRNWMKAGAALAGVVLSAGVAHATTIDFGTYAAGTQITTQYAGVSITGGVAADGNGGGNGQYAGTLANKSNAGVQMSFASLQSTVTGSYMASQGLTIAAYGAAGNLLETVILEATPGQSSSTWSVSGGSIANLSFMTASGASFDLNHVSFNDTQAGSSGTVAAQTSEPGTLLLMGTGLFGAAGLGICRAAWARRSEVSEIGDEGLPA